MLPLPVCQCGTTLFVLSTRRLRPRTNAKRLCATSTRWFDRRAERRRLVTHKVGTVISKKLGQAFQGLRVQGGALVAPSQWSEISYAVIESGEFENPIKGCSLWGAGSMPASHTGARAALPVYAVRWDYVGRHGADDDRPVTPTDCPVDSRVAEHLP